MGQQTRAYEAKELAPLGTLEAPITLSIHIKNTGTAGVVTVTNETIDGVTQIINLAAGEIMEFNEGHTPNKEMTISCDGDATARVVYWRA